MAETVPREHVRGPSRAPLKHGLLDAVSWRDDTSPHWQMGVEWTSQGCSPLHSSIRADDDPIEKTLDYSVTTEWADTFTLYGDYKCSIVGTSPEDAEDYAVERLQIRESQGLETAFWDMLGDVSDVDSIDDLTEAEDWIGNGYGSQGLIHMTRGRALELLRDSYLEVASSTLRTKLGTRVVAGAGYSGSDIFVTSGLSGYQSEIFTSSSSATDLMDVRKNDLYAVAERTYAILRECGVARMGS